MPLFKCSAGKATPKKVIAYITDKNKAELVSVRNLFEDEDYARQFTDTQNLFSKGKKFDERKYYHIKLSCARQDNVSPRQAQRYAEEMAELLFPEHECVIATHTDTKTVHSHIVVNAVNPITGKKLHITSDEYGRMKDKANRIGEKYGFSYTDWRKAARHKRTSSEKHIILKGGTSWKEELREVIQEGTLNAKTEQDFKAYLKECYGVEITRSGKDYSYLHPEKKKPVRGARLGQNYTKSEVLKRIGKQRPQPILDDKDEIITDNQQVMELNSAVDNLLAVTQGGLLQKALALSNEKCNNLVSRLNVQVMDLKLKVNDLTENNAKFVNGLKENVESVTRRLERLTVNQTEMTEKVMKEVRIATARAIELTITDFQKKIDESAKQVGVQLKETEKEIMKLKEGVSFERGFRRFLFWATPALLLVQSIIMIISILA